MQTQSVQAAEDPLNSIKTITETADEACHSFKDLISKVRNRQNSAEVSWNILSANLSNDEVWKDSNAYDHHFDDKYVEWCSPNEEQSGTFQRVAFFKIRALLKPPHATSPLDLYAQIGPVYLSLSQVVMDPTLRWLLVDFLGLNADFLEKLAGTQPSCWLQEKFRAEDFDMDTLAGRRYVDVRETAALLSQAANGASSRTTGEVLSRATDEVLSRAGMESSWTWLPKPILAMWEWIRPGALLRASRNPKAFFGPDVA
ncbi:hypothetical protein LTR95_006005 [Oleoguttula sp. CCFEE 5521]